MITEQQVADTTSIGLAPATGDWSLGWRYEPVSSATGGEELIRIPLTAEEARHPKEGYIMPERTEHDFISDDLCDMLRAHFADHPEVAVFRNLVIHWDRPDVGDYAPDVAVVAPVHNRDENRSQFIVADEGARPLLTIEVVSRSTRRYDRVDKVRDYALVGVQEYVYIDVWERRGQVQRELAGFCLEDGRYLPILPDEDGALFLKSVNLRIGLDDGRVWLEDTATGQELLTNLQAQSALRTTESALAAAEARIAALEAELAVQRQQDNSNH
jgi:Uma2 family endonuclease